jgi:predicted DCC family thiol-disulfide oxidoreductase YuxK
MKHDYAMIYDGQCPLCASGARFARVDAAQGQLTCVDARKDERMHRKLNAAGLDIDQGVVVIRDGSYLQGADAVHALALAAPRHGLFNRANRWLFGSAERARRIYPLFLAGRNLLLKLLGRQPIGA